MSVQALLAFANAGGLIWTSLGSVALPILAMILAEHKSDLLKNLFLIKLQRAYSGCLGTERR